MVISKKQVVCSFLNWKQFFQVYAHFAALLAMLPGAAAPLAPGLMWSTQTIIKTHTNHYIILNISICYESLNWIRGSLKISHVLHSKPTNDIVFPKKDLHCKQNYYLNNQFLLVVIFTNRKKSVVYHYIDNSLLVLLSLPAHLQIWTIQ